MDNSDAPRLAVIESSCSMEDSISNRRARHPGLDSGEARRNRLSEFHQNNKRAPNFYAKPGRELGSSAGPTEFEGKPAAWEPLPVRPKKGAITRMGWLKTCCFLAMGAIGSSLLVAPLGYLIGRERGRISANRNIATEQMRTIKRLPEAEAARLDKALVDLQTGQPKSALETLLSVRRNYPQAGSLSYLAALAALQAGQFLTAEPLVADSIRAGQRLSDSLALQSILEWKKGASQSAILGIGKPDLRAEEFLRAAITVDAANPTPHFELARLLRDSNRRQEARQEIRAAQARLTPLDARSVMEVTLALMELEDTTDDQIFAPPKPPRNLTENLAAAYAAMRQGNFSAAANFLRDGRAMTSPDIFGYLLNDPVFQRYRDEPAVTGFWK